LLDIPLGIAAVVLATIRDNQPRFAVGGSLPHLIEAQVDGIDHAVSPPALTESRLLCKFSYFDVKSEICLNFSLKLISRNSSWRFEVLKNGAAASLDFLDLVRD